MAGLTPRRAASIVARDAMKILQAGIIVLLGFWVFSPALGGEWLFDDIQRILANSGIHTVTGLWRTWFAPTGSDYFPLTQSVQCVQWLLWGRQTLGYHLTNVVLHLASALLLWRLLGRLGVRFAWLGGLLFAIHPLTVESVAWISELKNTLSLPLLLIAMLAYLHYDAHGDRISWLRSLAAFTASLLAKTSGVMFPVVLLLYAWWRHGRIRRADWKSSAAFFVVALELGWVTLNFQHRFATNFDPSAALDPFSRLLRAGLIVGFYISKIFWPADLDIIYFRWNVRAALPWEIFTWAILALFLGWLVTRRSAWSRHALLGVLFFLINLVPVLGFTWMIWMNYSWVADHFVYLPMIGIVGLVAAAAGDLYDRHIAARRWISVAVAVMIGALAWQSHAHAKLFSSSIALWTYNLENDPQSWMAYNNLAVALAGHGDAEGAIRVIQQELHVLPDQSLAYGNLGNAWLQMGRIPEALDAERKAVSLLPQSGPMHSQLGNALVQAGQFDDAIAEYQSALQINPNDAEAHSDLAAVFIQTRRPADAAREARRAIEIDSTYPAAHNNLGLALATLGEFPEAVKEFALAASLAPDDAEVQYNWGVALVHVGNKDEAYQHLQKAGQIDPRYGERRGSP